jgi:hypothetical protein
VCLWLHQSLHQLNFQLSCASSCHCREQAAVSTEQGRATNFLGAGATDVACCLHCVRLQAQSLGWRLGVCSCTGCACRDIYREEEICALGSEVVKSLFDVSQRGRRMGNGQPTEHCCDGHWHLPSGLLRGGGQSPREHVIVPPLLYCTGCRGGDYVPSFHLMGGVEVGFDSAGGQGGRGCW